jgi:hypothetical protein
VISESALLLRVVIRRLSLMESRQAGGFHGIFSGRRANQPNYVTIDSLPLMKDVMECPTLL